MRPEMPVRHHSIVTWEKGHVRAAIVELSQGAAELVGVAAAPVDGIGRTSYPDIDRWSAGCNEALSQAEEMTPASCGRKVVPNYVTMSVPSEIVRNLSVVVSSRRRHEDRGITPDELKRLLKRGYRKAQDLVGSQSEEVSGEVIHGSVAEIMLDGQAIIDPLGLYGEQLELRMSFYLAPREWIRALQIVAERLQLGLTAIVPHHVAYASPLPNAATLLILLDEYHSIICMGYDGHIGWTAKVDVGERQIVAATAGVLDLRGREADVLMRAYRARQVRKQVELKLASVFWVELRRWMAALADEVKRGTGRSWVPHRMYFVDITRRMPEAHKSLETPFWEQALPFDRCPEVIDLDVNAVRNVLDCTARAGGQPYLLLRTLAYYVARLYAPGNNLDRELTTIIHW